MEDIKQITSKSGKDCGWEATHTESGDEVVKQDTREQFIDYLVNIWSGEDFSTEPDYPTPEAILAGWEAQTGATWEEVKGKWWMNCGPRGIEIKEE